MEEIKFVENPRINSKVAEIIETLKEEIIFNFRPKSIILTGSFGRGEATVIGKNGKLKFLSDCEIIIIPYKWIFSRKKLNEFEREFYQRTSLKVEIWGFTPTLYLFIPFMKKRIKPTIANYDLKYGSKVMYGKNYLERIPDFKSQDIPLWEGIRLLFNRMAEALKYFSLKNPSKEMVFWANKIILACQDALLLSLGKYACSYKKRNEMFQNLFAKHFDELEDAKPNLLDLTAEATQRKLNGPINVSNSIEYWFDIAEVCDKVFRYVIKKEMGIEFGNYLDFQEKYIKHSKVYFRDSKISYNFKIILKSLLLRTNVPPKIIFKIWIPWKHVIYSLIPLLYFSLSRDLVINKPYINKLQQFMSSIYLKEFSLQDDDILNNYKHVKEQILNLWRTLG